MSTTASWPQSTPSGRWALRLITALLVATFVYWALARPTPIELMTFVGLFGVVFALVDSLVQRLLTGSP